MVLDFLGKIVVEVGGDTKFPRVVPKSTATVQGMVAIVLNGALSNVPMFISDDLLDVIKKLSGTVVPTRARSDLDLFTSSRECQLQNLVSVRFVIRSVEGRDSTAKSRRDQCRSPNLAAGLENAITELFRGHGTNVIRAVIC